MPPPTATASPVPTATATPTATPLGQWALEVVPPPWPIDCENDVAWDGYIFPALGDYCIPGLLTRRALSAPFPRDFYGVLSSYAPYAMEYMEDRWNANYPMHAVRRGQGIALTTCGMMGYVVWLRLPGEGWHGPFRVVDCSAPAGVFQHIAVAGLAVEIGYTVAQDWVLAAPRVDVHMGSYPAGGWDGVYLARWWVENVLEWETGYPLIQNVIVRDDGTTYLWPELE